MIKQSLIVAVVLLGLHVAYIHHSPMRWPLAQHQWQHNLITAQRFLYEEDAGKSNLLVGSSLTDRIPADKLPDTGTLAFSGLSVFDGLNVLLESPQRPKNVYIEMNMVLRGEDEGFKSSLENAVLFRVRKQFPSMRDENEPVSLVMQHLRKYIVRLQTEKPHGKVDADLFGRMLALQVGQNSAKPATAVLQQRFDQLKKDVRELQKRGMTVIFFEMPMNEKLYDLPTTKTVETWFYANFPPKEFPYIPRPTESYVTTDGVHLGPEEAERYTEYFKAHMIGEGAK